MSILVYVFIFIIGLFLGSFYNVVALRTLEKQNIVYPASHCTSCQHALGPLDLVPVLSWLTLSGKCRYCQEKISAIYPFGELLTAISYTLVFWRFGIGLEALIHLTFITIMIFATVTDLKSLIVPDRFVVLGLVLVGTMRYINGQQFTQYVLSGTLSFVALLLVMVLSGGKMGGADVKIYALIGLTLGLSGAIGSLFYSSFIGVLVSFPTYLKKGKAKEIPFVPFITSGVLLVYVYNLYAFLF